MFTGLICGIGRIFFVERHSDARRISIEWDGFADSGLSDGDSVAVDGVCLSLERIEGTMGIFVAVEETIARTTLGDLKAGDGVNIELPATMETFLSGHIVQGHIDCTGKIVSLSDAGTQKIFKIEHPQKFSRYVVQKGSIAVDGISLTVASCGDGWFECAIIPETMRRTTLQFKRTGDLVNIEFDVLAKYIERLLTTKSAKNMEDDIAAVY